MLLEVAASGVPSAAVVPLYLIFKLTITHCWIIYVESCSFNMVQIIGTPKGSGHCPPVVVAILFGTSCVDEV